MSKARKAKNAKLPLSRLAAKAKNAAGAAATAGRSRVFADKGDKLAKQSADPEIAEGLEEYEDKKKAIKSGFCKFSVKVGMIIDLGFDASMPLPVGKDKLKAAVAGHLIDHPAWTDEKELPAYIDSVEEIERMDDSLNAVPVVKKVDGKPNQPAKLLQVAIYIDPNKIKGDLVAELQHWLEVDTSWPDYINSVQVTG